MTTLLIPLIGMQSWGGDARFNYRFTNPTPTKSAVIGLCCAALGIGHHEKERIAVMASLRFGVRIDCPGEQFEDYHTVRDVRATANDVLQPFVTHRYYLLGAKFLTGLEGDRVLLETIHDALLTPKWPLYLGRRVCVPQSPLWVHDGLVESDLATALQDYPRLCGDVPRGLEIETDNNSGIVVSDVPLCFGHHVRQFAPRNVERLDYVHN